MTSPSLTSQSPPASASLHPVTRRELPVPILLFVITVLSTTAVGMRYMHNFRLGLPPLSSDADVLPYAWVMANLRDFASGLPFSVTLVAILLAHEFGHYIACRMFGVQSTLPYLLPAPSLSGTFGAVIRLKSRVRTRSALIVIGASGPIAGFAVAILTVFLGLHASTYSNRPVLGNIESPLLITGVQALLGGSAHAMAYMVPHPILVASWIGLLITALNLIPAGQLDGGHILYALSPQIHRVSTRIVIALLATMGVVFWGGWLLWAILLMLPGMRHPKVPAAAEVTRGQYALIPVCAVLLALSLTPRPFGGYSLLEVISKWTHHAL